MRVMTIALAATLLIPAGTVVIAGHSPTAAASQAGITEYSAAKKKPKKKPAQQEQFMRAAPSK
jgi:hypothetical protein